MSTEEVVAGILKNLTKYAEIFAQTYAALVEVGVPQEVAANEARTMAMLAVMPQPVAGQMPDGFKGISA